MEWNNKYTYPKSSRSIENGYRKYLFGDEKLPSVTTILSATKSEEEKACLLYTSPSPRDTERSRMPSSA